VKCHKPEGQKEEQRFPFGIVHFFGSNCHGIEFSHCQLESRIFKNKQPVFARTRWPSTAGTMPLGLRFQLTGCKALESQQSQMPHSEVRSQKGRVEKLTKCD
jgi:hypothetical protein